MVLVADSNITINSTHLYINLTDLRLNLTDLISNIINLTINNKHLSINYTYLYINLIHFDNFLMYRLLIVILITLSSCNVTNNRIYLLKYVKLFYGFILFFYFWLKFITLLN
jgi:hypothetical protein